MTRLKQKQRYSPDVHITDNGVVEKTYRDKVLPLRLIGCLFIFWESFIYSKIQGIEGIPRFLGKPDIYTMHISYMGGENLRNTKKKPDADYFENLKEILKQTHDRCIVHLDMRNRRNYGIDENGNPYLIDFAPSMYLPFNMNKALTWIDRLGMLKVKAKLCPELLNAHENRNLLIGNVLSSLWLPKKAFNLSKSFFRFLGSLTAH
jgi:hypothetical protein